MPGEGQWIARLVQWICLKMSRSFDHGTYKIFAPKVKVVLAARRKEKVAEVKVYSVHLKGKYTFSAHID